MPFQFAYNIFLTLTALGIAVKFVQWNLFSDLTKRRGCSEFLATSNYHEIRCDRLYVYSLPQTHRLKFYLMSDQLDWSVKKEGPRKRTSIGRGPKRWPCNGAPKKRQRIGTLKTVISAQDCRFCISLRNVSFFLFLALYLSTNRSIQFQSTKTLPRLETRPVKRFMNTHGTFFVNRMKASNIVRKNPRVMYKGFHPRRTRDRSWGGRETGAREGTTADGHLAPVSPPPYDQPLFVSEDASLHELSLNVWITFGLSTIDENNIQWRRHKFH